MFQSVSRVDFRERQELPKSFVVRPFCVRIEYVMTHLQRLIKLLCCEQAFHQQHRRMEGGFPVVKRIGTLKFMEGHWPGCSAECVGQRGGLGRVDGVDRNTVEVELEQSAQATGPQLTQQPVRERVAKLP